MSTACQICGRDTGGMPFHSCAGKAMSNITKCPDHSCNSRKHCYRHTAPSTAGNQAYADFNRDEGADKCEAYWPDEVALKRIREKQRESK